MTVFTTGLQTTIQHTHCANQTEVTEGFWFVKNEELLGLHSWSRIMNRNICGRSKGSLIQIFMLTPDEFFWVLQQH